jgi:hypothetical protein
MSVPENGKFKVGDRVVITSYGTNDKFEPVGAHGIVSDDGGANTYYPVRTDEPQADEGRTWWLCVEGELELEGPTPVFVEPEPEPEILSSSLKRWFRLP